MLKDALELLHETACNANGGHKLAVSNDKRTEHWLLPGGEICHIDLGLPARCHEFKLLADLIEFTKACAKPTVWYSDTNVNVICDEDDRLDTAYLFLPWSRRFGLLMEMSDNNTGFTQADFVRLLHRDFGVNAAAVALFRRLDFTVIHAAEGEHLHGKDRLGKSVQSEVKGTDKIPEEIAIAVPVYGASGERDLETLVCGIDINAQANRILFAPLPGQMDQAIMRRQSSIRTRLREGLGKDAKIYAGRP